MKIRINRDVTFNWKLTVKDESVDLSKLELSVEIITPSHKKVEIIPTIQFDTLVFKYRPNQIGEYIASVYINRFKDGETALDVKAFEGVRYSWSEDLSNNDNLAANNVELTGNLNYGPNLDIYLKIEDTPFEEGSAENSAVLKGEYQGYKNIAISQTSMAVGAATTAGLKGWYYSAIDFTNKKVTLSDKPTYILVGTTLINGGWSSGTPKIKVNDVISLVNDSKYDLCSKVTAVSGNVITVDSLPFTELVKDNGASVAVITGQFSDGYSVYIPDRPDAGIIDFGGGAFSEGGLSKATNIASHAEGLQTHAFGQYSHTEGRETKAGYAAHAEGRETKAIGEQSHAEGYDTAATGPNSHAEGGETTASGMRSHAEGANTIASGNTSHSEGVRSIASGPTAHAEGYKTESAGDCSHTEGAYTYASKNAAHAEGIGRLKQGNTIDKTIGALNTASHAEGKETTASGIAAHAEGYRTTASGDYSHAEGSSTMASVTYAHAEGYWTEASGDYSHAEGYCSVANGRGAHAEGGYCISDSDKAIGGTANGDGAHAEGIMTEATAKGTHAEGNTTKATKHGAHAEGRLTEATEDSSHAEGYRTKAKGAASHAEGWYAIANNTAEHASGQYNVSTKSSDKSKATHFSIGIGTSDTDRKNAIEVKQNGDIYITGIGGQHEESLQEIINSLISNFDRIISEFNKRLTDLENKQ